VTTTATPFHSRHSTVYHEFDDCAVGRGIPRDERLAGTGGKPRCDQCQRRGDGKPEETDFGHGRNL